MELVEQENAELKQTVREFKLTTCELKQTTCELEQTNRELTQKIEQLTEQPWSKTRELEDIAPSKIKWNDIYSKNIVNEEPYEFFLKMTGYCLPN